MGKEDGVPLMPTVEKVKNKSDLAGTVDSFLTKKRSLGKAEGEVEFLSVIDFIERFKLLPYGLYPVQRFIVKLYYNIPLDSVEKTIRISDKFNTKILHHFTEVEYLEYLYAQGRCNIRKQDGKDRRELVLVLGRRSGKSTLSAIFAAYELYKLLSRGHPQSYYGVPPGNEIRVMCLANDKEQASIVFGEMSAHVEQVEFFKSSKINTTQSYLRFQTEHDRQKFGETSKKGSIVATFKSSIAKGIRGRGVMCAILDELAFFVDNGKSSASQVYKAMVPSIAQFSPKDPNDKKRPVGPSHGRIISISSPDARDGFFYNLYQLAMSGSEAADNMLMIQAPTWEVNTSIDSSYYKVEYAKDPKSFDTEHGANFSDRVRGWIEDARDLLDCVFPDLKPLLRGNPREPFFCGIDFGLVGDGTAVALTRLNSGRIELGYHEAWYAKRRWSDVNPHLREIGASPSTPYCDTLQDVQRLDIQELAEWLRVLNTKFFIVKGVFDQYGGNIFEQELHKRGLKQFEFRYFTPANSSDAFRDAKMLMYNKQLALYDFPLPEMSSIESDKRLHSPLITELLELQATAVGKGMLSVEAPSVAGKHDDVSDALIRSLMLASEYVRANPGALDVKVIDGPASSFSARFGYTQYHRMRERLHGPPPKERRIPRARMR
jgi:hypothetical protein